MSDPSLVRFNNMFDLCYLGLENMSDSSLLGVWQTYGPKFT
jgi:hypothetical protein